MDRGTYVAASSGLYSLRKLEVVNNNLANVNTPGFKKQMLVGETQTFDATLAQAVSGNDPYARADHERTPGVTQIQTKTDFSLGPIKFTGNDLDVALRDPSDFLVVTTPDGDRYTRAGNLTLNSEGQLTTHDGFLVRGDGGAITTEGPGVKISAGGTVTANDVQVGRLQVVHFEEPQNLERIGGNLFLLPTGNPPPVPQESPELEPRSLEMSNVSAITSVIDLISATRAFEAYTKSAKTIDEMNNTAISRIGKRG